MNVSARNVFMSGLMFWIVISAIGLFFLYPIQKRLRLGIDLAGGSYITLSVATDKAVESVLLDKMDSLVTQLKDTKKIFPESKNVEKDSIVLKFSSMDAAQAAATLLKASDRTLTVSSESTTLKLSLTEAETKRIKDDAVLRIIEVLRSRLDKLGVGDIMIAAQGERNIVIELPGITDPQQAKALIGTAAVLEFKIVEKAGNTREELLADYDHQVPAGMEVVSGNNSSGARFYLVPRRATVTGKDLKESYPKYNEQKGEMNIFFEFSREGGDKFYEMTSKNHNKTLAAILDGVVVTAATIRASIRESGIIEGDFTPEYAKEISLLLKSGSFVAPVSFEEERQIGPTLGAESIRQGFISCAVGLGLLFLFSLYYYHLAGLFAFIALIFNLILILVGLSLLGATLTLPGIGGMVLTIGMAIDASILIYERIKEELASGIAIPKAVNDGFRDAMRVILDSNLTTFIVGLVLYYFGTGPIQGFAVTMMLGIVSTLITGLFFLKSIFTFVLTNFRVQKLSI